MPKQPFNNEVRHEQTEYHKAKNVDYFKVPAYDLILTIVAARPDPTAVEQHFCADKGYDFEDVHAAVEEAYYIPHIKHRRRRNEPKIEECPIPGELQYPARR